MIIYHNRPSASSYTGIIFRLSGEMRRSHEGIEDSFEHRDDLSVSTTIDVLQKVKKKFESRMKFLILRAPFVLVDLTSL